MCDAFQFHQGYFTCVVRLLPGEYSLEGASRRAADHEGHPPWVKMEVLAASHCAYRCFERSDEGRRQNENRQRDDMCMSDFVRHAL